MFDAVPFRSAACCLAVLAFASLAVAGEPVTVTMTTSKDNTLIESATGSVSLGAAEAFYVGRVGVSGGGTLRRGVIAFDVAAAIPEGAGVTHATLSLFMANSLTGSAENVVLRRLTSDWGEGTSTAPGGKGGPSTENDATWQHRFWPDVFWDSPGGDFVNQITANQTVAGFGWYTWNSEQLVADVQDWLDNPASNFGWVVRGNEASLYTAKQFVAREGPPNLQPVLEITYVMEPKTVPGDLTGNGSVGVADLLILLGAWGKCAQCTPRDCPADLDGNCEVSVSDLLILLSNWGNCRC